MRNVPNGVGIGTGIGVEAFSWVGTLFQILAWVALIGLLAALIYALVRAFWNIDPMTLGGATASFEATGSRTDDQRIENLPVQPTARKGSFLEMARQLYQLGNYSEAIVYLFSHRLLQLDRAGLIRLGERQDEPPIPGRIAPDRGTAVDAGANNSGIRGSVLRKARTQP